MLKINTKLKSSPVIPLLDMKVGEIGLVQHHSSICPTDNGEIVICVINQLFGTKQWVSLRKPRVWGSCLEEYKVILIDATLTLDI